MKIEYISKEDRR